jgi:Ca2+-binding EF-hand superfamily protein
VNLSLFCDVVMENRPLLEPFASLRSWFAALDPEGTGSVSMTRLRGTLDRAGAGMSDRAFEDMFAEVDCDKDGRMSYWEFERCVRGGASSSSSVWGAAGGFVLC